MSTNITEAGREVIAAGHHGGIFYDLAGHMLDQVVWILGATGESDDLSAQRHRRRTRISGQHARRV